MALSVVLVHVIESSAIQALNVVLATYTPRLLNSTWLQVRLVQQSQLPLESRDQGPLPCGASMALKEPYRSGRRTHQ